VIWCELGTRREQNATCHAAAQGSEKSKTMSSAYMPVGGVAEDRPMTREAKKVINRPEA